jgi:signal transduction histidine kinase
METAEKFQNNEIGKPNYVNKNCFLVRTLGYSSSERCQYCELKFRHCLFFQYLVISMALIIFLLILSLILERRISQAVVISIFSLILVYGYYLNKSTEKIIKANFAQKIAKEALEKLTGKLEEKVEQRTKNLKIANEQLKKLDTAKSEFISIASHQLRTPLTVIKGYISMMLEGNFGKLSEPETESLKKVFKSNERLIQLVEHLLDISRINSGKMAYNLRSIDMSELVGSVIEELKKTLIERKDLTLVYTPPAKPLAKVKLDDEKIRQVVMNLIDNAIKYTKKGSVTVSLEEVGGKIKFCVSDSGMGIRKEDMVNLFKKFSRGSGTSLIHTEGTGLGLYVARMMIEAHHGKIWAESKGEGQGSKFCFELPVK